MEEPGKLIIFFFNFHTMQQLANDIYERVVTAKMFMDDNFHESLNLKQISQQAFFSRFHFHRLFTRIYKKTPHQYLTILRLQRAKALLEKEGISITEVCNGVGFESLGSFSTLFRKQHGYAPQFYRNIAYLKKKLASLGGGWWNREPLADIPRTTHD